ncbi:MAG: YcaO-like family protein [Desulfobulbaceae bacterium]|jgi:ribosomal protein S12 methylthiotransferase accessory factor|nr:YcaO-like family protein [Desulfobulbaceae bacterium]MDY0350536.1 YcaO-like family protein [Desulfobulbaceae bacterium]
MEKKKIRLSDCRKQYTYDQDKACTPQETIDRFMRRLQEINLDILREVRRIDTGRLDIPVYFSMCGKDALETIGNKKQMGKGSTPVQSRASACMELGERFSFFSFIKNRDNFVIGDYERMQALGYPVLDLEFLLASVHDATRSREMLARLLQGLPMRWTWATNLTREEEVLVPFSWFFAINEFNGPSAGNTPEESILQGICEIVERHVCALVTRNRIRTPGIDPASVQDPVARQLLDKFTRCGIEVYLNDFSLDTGIPTVGALCWDPATFPEKSEIVYTAGTTPDPAKALIRALTEVAQLAGDFHTEANYVASGLPKPLTLDEVDYVVRPARMTRLDEMVNVSDADLHREVKNCLVSLERIGLDVLVVDTMHPDLGIPTFYTIVPGAHFRERAAGGDAALFAAKLAAELLEPADLETKLSDMQSLLPDAYYLEFYRGKNLYDLGNPAEALAHFDRALDLDPEEEDLPYLYAYKGCCLRDMARFDEAIEALETGRRHDDERPDIHNMLGVCHFKGRRYAAAAEHFRRAVELNPVSAIDYANLAINLQHLGCRDEAMHNYRVALSMDPDIEFARRGLAELLEQHVG